LGFWFSYPLDTSLCSAEYLAAVAAIVPASLKGSEKKLLTNKIKNHIQTDISE